MDMYGSLIFDYCSETQPTRRSARILTRKNEVPNPDSNTQEATPEITEKRGKKRRGRKPKPMKTKNKTKFPSLDEKIPTIVQPSKVAASMRKIPEKILYINYQTKEILIKWKNLTIPEYLDRSNSIPPDVLALILEYKPNPEPDMVTLDVLENELKLEKTAYSIAQYRREQRLAIPDNFEHVTCHIKTE